MSYGSSIPEMLGFTPIPWEREELYSVASYQAQYVLYEDEAIELRGRCQRHSQIDLELSNRYVQDPEYRTRVDEACEDITATEPDEEVKVLMEKVSKTMKPPKENS